MSFVVETGWGDTFVGTIPGNRKFGKFLFLRKRLQFNSFDSGAD